ncbi:MAG: hypothetical protein JKX79_02155 [Labilibaculum sp.]|nr:hypothetical protein [Labilibaculum sp.]
MKLTITILRWIARFLGIFLFLFFIWFAIQIGSPDLNMMSEQEIKLFSANVIMLMGLIAVWKFEFIGSLLLISGYLYFAITNYSFWNGPVFPTFLFLGLLHLLCWSLSSFTKVKNNKISLLIFLN